MQLEEISSEEYGRITAGKGPVFCRQDFLELNKGKVDRVRYLLGKDKKNRIAFAVGEKDGQWNAPYSAPYATFIELQKDTKIDHFWDFVRLLNGYAQQCGICMINMTLPPDIYYRQTNTKTINALLGNGYHAVFEDVDHFLDLTQFNLDGYRSKLHYKSRNMLNVAFRSGISCSRCEDLNSKKEVYDIICKNHESKGYPVKMGLNEVLDTIKIIEHDFFLVQNDGISIAAAIIFHVTEHIVQVIYWGDIPNVQKYKPMNFLSFELVRYYKERGIEQIDIGPSSENGIPNFGLCNFKESIGCEVSSKYKFAIHF